MMTADNILQQRLANQNLSFVTFTHPEDIVSTLGAVQAQDYSGAKWALAQRLPHTTDAIIEQAFTEGKILRTHVMRPTWHFVRPKDITWMLELTGPRVSKAMSSYNKLLQLNDAIFTKSQTIITKLLKEKKIVIRQEIKTTLETEGIKTNVQRLAHLVMQAELDRVIISGPRRGAQFTYMLFSDRVPEVKPVTLDQALAELTKRYFTSHGPAQIQDFVWWSGLTTADANKGIEMNKKSLVSEEIEGKTYYFSPNTPTRPAKPRRSGDFPKIPNLVFLLPNYDEYTIGYKDRSAFHDKTSGISIYSMGALTYPHVILYQGKVIGTWRREVKKGKVVVKPKFAKKPEAEAYKEFMKTTKKYEEFLGLEVVIEEK